MSIVAVAMAGIAFVATNNDSPDREMSTVSQPATSETPSPTATIAPTPKPKPKKKAAVERDKVYVEIYNKTAVKGLAGSTATKATDVGWQVVATDNWVGGNIPSATVYYPSRLKDAAKLLAKDLGIERTVPAVDPMRGDRLTVILTADYGS
nr:LytR C-terminal domain-containing protein [Nocardioides daedukensis]